jgi:uncharacterized RDD family membrane protein YckC
MRCPKCQYISFDSGERCRNCGYEFSLTPDTTRELDLPIHTSDEPVGPLGDFALESGSRRSDHAAPVADAISSQPSKPITSSFDLPLFKERRPADNTPPLVTPPATPRPPLAVRRSTPATPKPSNRSPVDEPSLDLGPPDSLPKDASRPPMIQSPTAIDEDRGVAALVGPRCAAALLDAAILLTIGWIVLYLTLRICGLPFSRIAVIPAVPFASFLLLIAGGYLTLFTAAGGQTIGKMATGIRVVSMDPDLVRVPLGRAILRAAAYFASALPAGLGFLPALVAADRRAIHDRLADTRVVKA